MRTSHWELRTEKGYSLYRPTTVPFIFHSSPNFLWKKKNHQAQIQTQTHSNWNFILNKKRRRLITHSAHDLKAQSVKLLLNPSLIVSQFCYLCLIWFKLKTLIILVIHIIDHLHKPSVWLLGKFERKKKESVREW